MSKNKKGRLKSIGDKVCEDYLNFLPTSNSTKPPHIANGLFRRCFYGQTCNLRDVHEWIAGEGKNKVPTSTEIIEKYSYILFNGVEESEQNIKDFRFLLNDIFNQDNTIYPNYEMSAYNISSNLLIKGGVPAEAKIGEFLFDIISYEIAGNRSEIIDLINTALREEDDDLTKLIKPIISGSPLKDNITRINKLDHIEFKDNKEIDWNETKAIIREGFDNLAKNMKASGEYKNSLLVLERVVNFSLFSTFLFLVDALSIREKVPLLLDAGSDLDSIKKASELAYIFAKKSVEKFFVHSIMNIISDEITNKTIEGCREWIEQTSFFEDNDLDIEANEAIKGYFKSFCEDNVKPLMALAKALQIILYTMIYENESPNDFCTVLGSRGGLIGPKTGHARKRYLINSFTLETITLSVLSIEDLYEIEFKSLCEKLKNKYNIIIGANPEEDYTILTSANITQNTPGDLRGDLSLNSQMFADIYVSLGLGKQYADGVTIISWR